MQNRQCCSRFSIVKSDYAELPRPVHWILNTTGLLALAAPQVFSFLPWFLLTWGVDVLQSVFGMAAHGAVFALFDMLRLGTSLIALTFALELWSSRAEWAEAIYRIIDDSCKDFSELFSR